jgi:hypothetical protein
MSNTLGIVVFASNAFDRKNAKNACYAKPCTQAGYSAVTRMGLVREIRPTSVD